MATYRTSDNLRLSKASIDRRVTKAKHEKRLDAIQSNDYFCQSCGKGTGLDCSHTISVNECQKLGMSELAWDLDNIELECRACHMDWEAYQAHDKHNLQRRLEYIESKAPEFFRRINLRY